MNKIVIFGCSQIGAKIAKELKTEAGQQVLFYDNDRNKQDKLYEDCAVLNTTQFREYCKDAVFVLASIRFYKEMRDQLIGEGVSDDRIVLPFNMANSIVNDSLTTHQEIISRRTPREELGFVVDIAEHCNLNCQSCDHFSPLSNETFYDLAEFESDIRRMSEIMRDKIAQIALEGGEPLLNKDIVQYIRIAHEFLPEAKILILTNGILLNDMSQEFFDVCRECGAKLEVTKYPIDFDYDKVEALAMKHGVEFHYYDGGISIKTTSYKPLDLDGRQDKYESFHSCYMANATCVTLKNGRLYGCTLPPHIDVFNEYFDKDIKVTDKDYIYIYDDISAEDIFDFLCNPMSMCKYCKVKEWTHDNKWKTSKRMIEEWV